MQHVRRPFRMSLLAAAALAALAAPPLRAAAPAGDTPAAVAATDKPLAPAQAELLDLAARAASALPAMPHIKDRCRTQEAVVDACLKLDQPRRALALSEQISNWRRGTACADCALWFAGHGDAASAQHALDLAQQVADAPGDEDSQDWQRDRVVAAIARARAALGHAPSASEAAAAPTHDAVTVDAQLAQLDAAAKVGNMDEVHAALQGCAQLCDACYADADRRADIQAHMRAAWSRQPLPLCFDLLEQLAGIATAHGDQASASALAAEAHELMGQATWLPEDHVPLLARLAVMEFRAGDAESARREAGAARALFASQREKIADVFRAAALRPLAEAWRALGDTPTALETYAQAAEEGVANPNSRPRAEDLCATCCSLATQGLEPGSKLMARLHQIGDALGPPW